MISHWDNPIMHIYCLSCGKPSGNSYRTFCECGGIIEVSYDIEHVVLHDSDNPYVRFADLLPIRHAHDRLPGDAHYTPVIHAKALGKLLGMSSLYLKNETVLPTCSTKDRMTAVALGFMWEQGVRTFCTSSTGNSSTAYAHAIRAFPDMRLYLFTAEDFLSRVQHAEHGQIEHFCMRDASFVEAFEYSGTYAREHGLVSERGFFNLGRREGLKLTFFEASEQIPGPIDWYVQAISSAMGVYGTYKGAKELYAMRRIPKLPRLLCVQQEVCSPMVRAWKEGCTDIQPHHIVRRPTGIAEAILRGDPTRAYPHVRRIVVESNGDFESVSEVEIREARQMVEELEGVSPCFSASTAVAGLIKQVRADRFPIHDTVMINLTGADRPDRLPSRWVRWLVRNGNQWIEDTTSVEA
jgi:threonine synthase